MGVTKLAEAAIQVVKIKALAFSAFILISKAICSDMGAIITIVAALERISVIQEVIKYRTIRTTIICQLSGITSVLKLPTKDAMSPEAPVISMILGMASITSFKPDWTIYTKTNS